MNNRKWEIITHAKPPGEAGSSINTSEIIDILLSNRGLKTKKDQEQFLNPPHPKDLTLKECGLSTAEMKKAIQRIEKAQENKEKVIVYGDYDADGVTAAAILWEALYKKGLNVAPYLPERFSEGYGIKSATVEKLKKEFPDLSLIITVDNGIVAHKEVKAACDLGIDVIVTDHHQPEASLPDCCAVVHSTKLSGSGVSWILSRELKANDGLELAAIGTLADQLPLIGPNRSIAKYGLEELRKTKRPGLMELFRQSGIDQQKIGNYEVGFIIAPRINAMGRLKHAIESLRLICTRDPIRALKIAAELGSTNLERQKILDEVVLHARESHEHITNNNVIVIAHESYHEGIIGLAAARLTEEFYKPSIVISLKEEVAKASARSIFGFNIIEAIRATDNLILEGGGHPMAAGFSILPENITKFREKINEVAKELLTPELLTRRLKIDCVIPFDIISWDLLSALSQFEPTGPGNPSPIFVTFKAEILAAKALGKDKKHLKLTLSQDKKIIECIAFGWGQEIDSLQKNKKIDIAYTIEENTWNGNRSLQLMARDIKVHE